MTVKRYRDIETRCYYRGNQVKQEELFTVRQNGIFLKITTMWPINCRQTEKGKRRLSLQEIYDDFG